MDKTKEERPRFIKSVANNENSSKGSASLYPPIQFARGKKKKKKASQEEEQEDYELEKLRKQIEQATAAKINHDETGEVDQTPEDETMDARREILTNHGVPRHQIEAMVDLPKDQYRYAVTSYNAYVNEGRIKQKPLPVPPRVIMGLKKHRKKQLPMNPDKGKEEEDESEN